MSRKARKNVGLIGLGIIGSRVAANLRAAGFQVYVWNRSAKPVPNFLGSPAQVADSSLVIQIFVSDAAALFEVIESMAEVLTPKHVILCNATVGPEAVLEAAQLVEARGAQFLDAPFTGSKTAAEKRQLVYYVGGAEATYLRVRPVLEASSRQIIRLGEIGHAATLKVVTNMISAVSVQVLAEALSIVKKAGLDPELLAAAVEHNACRSGIIDLKLPKMIAGEYEPHFSLKHMFKDVQLGIHMANALDIEIPATTVTAGVMYGGLNQGWADLDFSVLFKNYASAPAPADEHPALEHSTPTLEAPAFETEPEVEVEQQLLASEVEEKPAADASDAENVTPAEKDVVAEKIPREETPAFPPQESNGTEPMDIEPAPESAKVIEAVFEAKSLSENDPVKDDEKTETPTRPTNFVRRWFVARSGR